MPMDKRENKRNWYLQIQAAFFDDPDYKRFRRRLSKDVRDGTAIYLKMILLAIGDGETKSAEDVILSFFHDEETFSEEVAYAINEDPEDVAAAIDTMLKCRILEEVRPDTWQIHFPDGTIGSITDSSLRSRKSREKHKMLQCNTSATNGNTDATQGQHECNLYNNNINNNSNSQIDSNNHINLTVTETDTETENSASGFDSAGGSPAGAAAADAAPRPVPETDLFSIDQIKNCIRKNKIDLSDDGAAAFLEEMRADNWTLYGKPVEKKYITRTLREWAKRHGEYAAADPEEEARVAEEKADRARKAAQRIQEREEAEAREQAEAEERKRREREAEARRKQEKAERPERFADLLSVAKKHSRPDNVPEDLQKLMERDGIPEYALMAFNGAKDYFPADKPISECDSDYITMYCIQEWDTIRDTIRKYAEVTGIEF